MLTRYLRRSIFLASLLSAAAVAATECRDPFAGISQNFLLQESFSCSAEVQQVSLLIKKTTNYVAPGPSSYFLSAKCAGDHKVMNLNYGTDEGPVNWQTTVNWSDVLGDDPDVIKIVRTCEAATIAILDARSQVIKNSEGQDILVSFQIFADESRQSMVAYVLASEDEPHQVSIRAPNGDLLTLAYKQFFNGGNLGCLANWSVRDSTLDPTLVAYILGWRDNRNFKCQASPSSWSPAGLIVVGVGLGIPMLCALACCAAFIVKEAYDAHKRKAYKPIIRDLPL